MIDFKILMKGDQIVDLEGVELDKRVDTAIDISQFALSSVLTYGSSRIVKRLVDAVVEAEPKKVKRVIFRISGFAVSYCIGDLIDKKCEELAGTSRNVIKAIKIMKEQENGSELTDTETESTEEAGEAEA